MLQKVHLVIGLLFLANLAYSQIHKDKDWCGSQCDAAGDEKRNTSKVFSDMEKYNILANKEKIAKKTIPLRIAFVQEDTAQIEFDSILLYQAIENLNASFANTNILFTVDSIELIRSELKLEQLSKQRYAAYNSFSKEHDIADMLTIYVFDFDKEFCSTDGDRFSCGRTGGFSYVLSDRTSNIVMSKFDLQEIKVLAHEMGHFWGLYHTFEEYQFGKDDFNKDNCHLVGDRVCDTPPDPGPLYEVYINYTACEFVSLTDDNGNEYRPLIHNYMSYYKPCYLKEYSFTNEQVEVINTALKQPIRSKYIQ